MYLKLLSKSIFSVEVVLSTQLFIQNVRVVEVNPSCAEFNLEDKFPIYYHVCLYI